MAFRGPSRFSGAGVVSFTVVQAAPAPGRFPVRVNVMVGGPGERYEKPGPVPPCPLVREKPSNVQPTLCPRQRHPNSPFPAKGLTRALPAAAPPGPGRRNAGTVRAASRQQLVSRPRALKARRRRNVGQPRRKSLHPVWRLKPGGGRFSTFAGWPHTVRERDFSWRVPAVLNRISRTFYAGTLGCPENNDLSVAKRPRGP